MPQSKDKEQPTLPDPALVSPTEASVVDAGNVVLSWAAVEGASEYFLEIARDPQFEDLVLNENLGNVTEVAFENRFEPDGVTYFWRVQAGNDTGWSYGDHVESFVASSSADADEHLSRPDERLGPVSQLMYSASVEAAAEATRSEAYYESEHEMGVEHEGVEAGQILGIALALAASVVMIVIVLFQWTRVVEMETRSAVVGISGYPELTRIEQEAERRLGEYAVVDEEAGIYQIPIDRAMDLLVEEMRQDGASNGPVQYPAE